MSFYFRKKIKKTENFAKAINDILPIVLNKIDIKFQKKEKNILLYWKNIIGEKLAPLTEAKKIVDGKLYIIVKSSTLYSLLSTQEKPKILNLLQKKYSKAVIKDIIFRRG